MTRVLITGGCGFVGTQLLMNLQNRKDLDITVLDNLMSQPSEEVDPFLPWAIEASRAAFINGDVRDQSLLDAIVPIHDVVVHLAGIVGAPACQLNKEVSMDVNYSGICRVLQAMRPGARIIFISSTSVYGQQSNPVDEFSTPNPTSEYGWQKLYGELAVVRANRPFVILRPATAFGVSGRIRVDLLPNTLAYLALTQASLDIFEPDVIRPFIHVIDFARALEFAIDGHLGWYEIYNLGNPELTMTKGHLAQFMASQTGAEITFREGTDPDNRNYDVSFKKFLSTGFEFLPSTLLLGYEQIKYNVDKIRANYQSYNTVDQTLRFLDSQKEKGYGSVYNTH